MSVTTFSDQLILNFKPLHLLNHPFYQAWMAGALSKRQLQNYAAQYYPHVLAFPRYVSAIHSQCEDDSVRPGLAHNLADEEGITGGEAHPKLWLDFAEELGVTKAEIDRGPRTRASGELVDGFLKLSKSSYAEGLGALVAYEHQIPEIAKSKIQGLKDCYGVDSIKALTFFQVHEQADVYHTETLKTALNRLTTDEQILAEAAAQRAGQLLWNFLTEAYEPAA